MVKNIIGKDAVEEVFKHIVLYLLLPIRQKFGGGAVSEMFNIICFLLSSKMKIKEAGAGDRLLKTGFGVPVLFLIKIKRGWCFQQDVKNCQFFAHPLLEVI